MEFISYKCDECGAVKAEANHWFLACIMFGPRFVITPWGSELPDTASPLHLCGLSCAVKAMQKSMQEVSG